MLGRAEIIFGAPDPDRLVTAKRLKWLHLPSAGADRYADRNLFCNKDIHLTNSRGVLGMPIAEYVLGVMLAFSRNLHLYARQKEEKVWKRLTTAKDFAGSTVGILGLGDIGTEIAKRAHACGARVIAVKRHPKTVPEYISELYGEDGIDTMLERCDYIVLALPYTHRTDRIMSAERLSKLKSSSFIVNISRGELIDQEALIEVLKRNRIAGAALDVTTPEPLPSDSPLWELPNVILTPHASAYSPKNDDKRFRIFNRNLKLYLEGKPLENRVHLDTGY